MGKVIILFVLVLLAIGLEAQKARKKSPKAGRFQRTVFTVDGTNGMDNSTCVKRCAKPDMAKGKKTNIICCQAFYTGASDNKCYLIVLTRGALKSTPTDLAKENDGFFRPAKSNAKRPSYKQFMYEVDTSNGIDQNKCVQRCAKPDVARGKQGVICCRAFYTGAADKKCYLFVSSRAAVKKVNSDLTLKSDAFIKQGGPKRQAGRNQRKGGKGRKRQRKGGKGGKRQRKGGKRQRKGGKRQRKGGKRQRKGGKGGKRQQRKRPAHKVYQLDDANGMDNKTCVQRCAKADLSKTKGVFQCLAFYSGATDNKCYLVMFTGSKFKAPSDLTLSADGLYKAQARSRQPKRKGGKTSRRQRKQKKQKQQQQQQSSP